MSEQEYLSAQVALEKLQEHDKLSEYTKAKMPKTKVDLPKMSPKAAEINKFLEDNNK